MKTEMAQAFTLITGRNVCGLSAYDLAMKTGISLERIQALEQGDTKITLNELDSVAKMLFYRKHAFLGLENLYKNMKIDDVNTLEIIRRKISDLPVNNIDGILATFKSHEKDGFIGVFLIESRLHFLYIFYNGAIRGYDNPDDDENWRDPSPNTPVKPISPIHEIMTGKDTSTVR